jgi:hypothetical protein
MIDTLNDFRFIEDENVAVPHEDLINTINEDSFAERESLLQTETTPIKKKRVGCNCKKT